MMHIYMNTILTKLKIIFVYFFLNLLEAAGDDYYDDASFFENIDGAEENEEGMWNA